MNFFLFICLLLSSLTAAVAADTSAKVQVLQMHPKFPLEKMADEGVELHPLSDVGKNEEVITAIDRDVILNKANLIKTTANWDALEKDLLLLRAEKQEPQRAAKNYSGKISSQEITRLKKIILSYRKEKAVK